MRINMKKLLVLLAALGLMTQMSACKANNSQDDAEFVENADTEKVESDDQLVMQTDAAPDALATSSDNLATDKSLEAALGETSTPPADQVVPDMMAESSAMPSDMPLDAAATETTNTPPPEIAAAPSVDESALLNDVPAQTDTLGSSTTTSDYSTMAPMESSLVNDAPVSDVPMTTEAPKLYTADKVKKPKKTYSSDSSTSSASIKKLNRDAKLADLTPYAYEGGFVNTAYIVRPNENLKLISQTIFGSDKSKELKKINSFLKSRAPRAGDKIFYVSPNRPSDSARMITYYEDTGMVPETYVAKKGDNLRKVAKNLLGYSDGWKEVWATNGLETKAKMSEGDTFRYWKSAATITPSMPLAQNDGAQVIDNPNQLPAAPTQEPMAMNPSVDMAQQPEGSMPTELPPPPPDMAANPPPPAPDMAPPPPPDMAANPPPPPAPDMAPPPPAPDMAATAESQSDKKPAGDATMEEAPVDAEQDMYTMLGIGVLVCGAIAFVIVKRRKKKAMEEMQMGETGVGV